MDAQQIVADLEARAKAASLSIAEVCRRAGIAPITFRRWRSGDASPTLNTLAGVERVIAQQEARGAESKSQLSDSTHT